MNDRIKEAFDQVQAGEELKERTRAFLSRETNRYQSRIPCLRIYQTIASAAACFLFVMLGGYWFYFIPTAKISIDVNPSIELGINRFDRVVAIEAYNDDGQDLAASVDIRFKRYEEAVSRILKNENVAALLSQDEIMTITVMESGGTQSVRILSDMESCAAGHPNTYCYFADSREVEAAHEHGMSCGKYRAFLELQSQRPDITVTTEDIQGMTMREIRDLIDETPGYEDEGASQTGTEEEGSLSGGRQRHRNHGVDRRDPGSADDWHHGHRGQ